MSAEYHRQKCHTVIDEKSQKSGNGMAEHNQTIQTDVVYRQKNIRVYLRFSEEQSGKNAGLFYDNLKKIYMERDESRGNTELPALSYQT